MGRVCSIYGERRGAYNSKYPGIDGRIILRWIFRKWDGGMDWIALAEDRDRCQTLVNAVMN